MEQGSQDHHAAGRGAGCRGAGSLRTPSKLNTRQGQMFSHGCDRSGRSTSGRRCPRETERRGGTGAKQLGTMTGHLPGTDVEYVFLGKYVWCENVCLG